MTTDPVEHEYPYRYSAGVVFGPAIAFGVLGGLMVYLALTYDEEGVVLFHIIELSPLGVRIMGWVLAGLFLGLFVACLPIVVNFLTTRRRLAVTATALLVPRGFWSTADRPIPYREIAELVPHLDTQGRRSLIIRHPKGKFVIEEIALPSRAVFEEICSLLRERRALAAGPLAHRPGEPAEGDGGPANGKP